MRLFLLQQLKNKLFHLPKAILANYKYGFPANDLKIIGVTGTDGKTTTVNMIYSILKKSGKKVGMISTISAKFGDEEYDTGFHVTSPESKDIQKFLRKMADSGCEWVILESTSHGLDQYRFWGIKLDIAVYTNITREHLDYHKSESNYINAKFKLTKLLRDSGSIVLNNDDAGVIKMRNSKLKDSIHKIITYGIKNESDFNAVNIQNNEDSINFELKAKNKLRENDNQIKIPILGEYNIYNVLAAIAACNEITRFEYIKAALSEFQNLNGRMENMQTEPFHIFVDFAHTPNALDKCLTTLKNKLKPEARLIVIFGSAGLRDVEKRYSMGEVAAKLANIIILTAEDPRTENLGFINNQITEGISKVGGWNLGNQLSEIETSLTKLYYRFDEMNLNSRIDAIKFAFRIAKEGDIVVVCGKGHEKSLCFGNTEYPYSDQDVIKDLILKSKLERKKK